MTPTDGRSASPRGWTEVRRAPADAALAALLEERAVADLPDADLVDALAAQQRLANAAEARVLALMGELDSRRAAEGRRDVRDGRDISSRAQVVTEVVAATRQPKGRVEHLLHVVQLLRTRADGTWRMLQSGRIGAFTARVIAEQLDRLVDESLLPAVEARILAEVTADNSGPTAALDLAASTSTQVRTIAVRAVAEAEPGRHEARHRRAFADRRVTRHGDAADADGMGVLSLHYDALTTEAIYHRLGLIARNTGPAADSRTLSQRVADLAAALLTGDLAPVTTPNSELEEGAAPLLRRTGAGAGAQVHVTMTLASLAGYSDAPARLIGGGVVPASVARRVAYQPGSTWYRLLTDDTGRMLDLSSSGYRPGAPLSRAVRALHQTCVQVGCTRPATVCEHDHEVPWPQGRTEGANLSPKCRAHHVAKTAGRFVSTKLSDGTVRWRYPTGHTYTTGPPRHPVDVWCADWQEPESLADVQRGLAARRREDDRRVRERVADLKRRMDERRLARWESQAPPDPPGRDMPDPEREAPGGAVPVA